MRFLFISLSLVICITISCKNESELKRLDLEELTIQEEDSVRRLLELSKSFLQKKQYEEAKEKLTIIIDNFGTYPEFADAKELLEEAQNGADLNTIANSNDLKELDGIKNNSTNPDIRGAADEKMKDVIQNSDDIAQLEGYLNEPGFKKYENEANDRLGELLENLQEQQYQDALSSNSAQNWKNYINHYPDDPRKKEIQDRIIQLEVQDIFSGEYNEMPSFNRTSNITLEVSSIEIKNDTRYTLTLRYSGMDVERIDIPAGQTRNVNIKSGFYRVTASVDAYNVRNYAGTETLNGEYSVVYYIQ